jgi:hypothetical protein
MTEYESYHGVHGTPAGCQMEQNAMLEVVEKIPKYAQGWQRWHAHLAGLSTR